MHGTAERRWLDKIGENIPILQYMALWAGMNEAWIAVEFATEEAAKHRWEHVGAVTAIL
jgi:hypothetical protein